jgi:hypothetical protein
MGKSVDKAKLRNKKKTLIPAILEFLSQQSESFDTDPELLGTEPSTSLWQELSAAFLRFVSVLVVRNHNHLQQVYFG